MTDVSMSYRREQSSLGIQPLVFQINKVSMVCVGLSSMDSEQAFGLRRNDDNCEVLWANA